MQKNNFLLFITDQMRADSMAHLGNEASCTPNFDHLVSEGVSFENAYCQNPVCAPSRCSFNTGWYPHTREHRTIHYLMEDGQPNLLKSLKKNGYHVYILGKTHFFNRDHMHELEACCDYEYIGREMSEQEIHGQEEKAGQYRDPETAGYYSFYNGCLDPTTAAEMPDAFVFQQAKEMIENGELKEPFCLYLSFNDPHPPYQCEEPWFSLIDKQKLPKIRQSLAKLKDKPSMLKGIFDRQGLQSYSEEDFVAIRTTYLGMVAKVDYQFGEIRQDLEKHELFDRTNVLVFSDHGDYTGDYGIVEKSQNTFEDPLTNVPFIIRPAKGVDVKPRISSELVELVDIPSTVAEMGGFELEYTQFGRSLVHLLAREEKHKDAVFSEGGRIIGERQAMEGVSTKESI